MLQQYVGKPARRCADVGADGAGHVNPEGLECVREFHPAPADPRMLEFLELDVIFRLNRDAWLRCVLPIHQNAPSHDQRLCLRSRFCDSAFNERHVETGPALSQARSARSVVGCGLWVVSHIVARVVMIPLALHRKNPHAVKRGGL